MLSVEVYQLYTQDLMSLKCLRQQKLSNFSATVLIIFILNIYKTFFFIERNVKRNL